MNTWIKIGAVVLMSFIAFSSCKKDEEEEQQQTQSANAALFDLVKSETGYTFYRGGSILPGTSPSPHGSFKLRFNSTAQAALDATGELPTGGTFPENSILVKDVYTNGALSLVVVMQKKASDANAASGWVWAEYKPSGEVVYSVSLKGAACTSCHSSTKHRDFVKTFDLH